MSEDGKQVDDSSIKKEKDKKAVEIAKLEDLDQNAFIERTTSDIAHEEALMHLPAEAESQDRQLQEVMQNMKATDVMENKEMDQEDEETEEMPKLPDLDAAQYLKEADQRQNQLRQQIKDDIERNG